MRGDGNPYPFWLKANHCPIWFASVSCFGLPHFMSLGAWLAPPIQLNLAFVLGTLVCRHRR